MLQSFSGSHKPQGKMHPEFKAFHHLALPHLLVLSLTWRGLVRPDHSSFLSCYPPAFIASVDCPPIYRLVPRDQPRSSFKGAPLEPQVWIEGRSFLRRPPGGARSDSR